MKDAVGILLPTRDNAPYLDMCLTSLRLYTTGCPYTVYVVNNGEPGSCAWIADQRVVVVQHGGERGWVEGLQAGLAASREPYLLLLNDDTHFMPANLLWLSRMLGFFEDEAVGAVGPSSNLVSGPQSIFRLDVPTVFAARYLIGFCMLLRRTALEAAGGIVACGPSADDLDLSFRLHRAGYTLVGDRGSFVYHHGFVTGRRVHGPATEPGGYNSREWGQRDVGALTARYGHRAVEWLLQHNAPPTYGYVPLHTP